MGCWPGSVKTEKYFEFNSNTEEKEIRAWEKSLGFFRDSFSHVSSLILIDEERIDPESINYILEKEFSMDFISKVAGNIYFKYRDSEEYYTKRIMQLILLTTIHIELRNDIMSYYDKSSFIFSICNRLEEYRLNRPIEKFNETLVSLITDLTYISCVTLVDIFISTQTTKREGSFPEMKRCLTEITKLILDRIFSHGKQSLDSITFEELNSKFGSDPNVSSLIN